MWNKRNEDSYPPPAAPEAAPRETAFRNTPPPARPDPPRHGAVIGPSMQIKGEIRSREELYVDGEVEGMLELDHALTVGPNGKVKAGIKAREVSILGSVKGNVEAVEKISIKHNGSLVGDIKTAGIVIDDGAYFKGSIDIVRPEPARSGAKNAAAPREAATPQEV